MIPLTADPVTTSQPTQTREAAYRSALPSDIERGRYATLRTTLAPYVPMFRSRRVLDFGASYGLSAVALIELGAASVVGVEPEEPRVTEGIPMLADTGYGDQVRLIYLADTRQVPLPDASVDFVLVNAVFEHIPQPRDAYVRELWRVLAPGGTMLVNETPNKYLPWDFHTTKLPLINWLPSRLARRLSIWRGRYSEERDWDHSGWRGMGYYELVHAIPGPYRVTHEATRPRHRAFRALGLPAALLDPYPTWLLHKPA